MEFTGISITLFNALFALSMAIAFALAIAHDAKKKDKSQ